jgi:hypothetical protein
VTVKLEMAMIMDEPPLSPRPTVARLTQPAAAG